MRESLDENSGMWFLFPDDTPRTFWMKDTLIPLDIIFVNSTHHIVHIATALPCTQDPCPTYPSISPAQYVLEVNANYTTRRGISVGDVVNTTTD